VNVDQWETRDGDVFQSAVYGSTCTREISVKTDITTEVHMT